MSLHDNRQQNRDHEKIDPCRAERPGGVLSMEAEKARLVGFLTGFLAHDLNNPLCGVTSVLERFARKSTLSEIEQQLLRLALEQCACMKNLLRDIQDFVHASVDEQSRFDLNHTLTISLRLMHKQLKLSQIKVHFAEKRESQPVVGCEDQIKQMLLYIFVVICQALAGNRAEISLKVFAEDNFVRLLLRFQVPEEATARLSRLFADLLRLNPTLDRGLTIAHSILEFHGGTMWQTEVAQGRGEMVVSFPVER